MAGRFTAVVLVATAVTFLVKWQASSPHALDDAIALLIVTCPCALALATPLAITVAVGRASRRGMLIKGGDALREVAAQLGHRSPGLVVEHHLSPHHRRGACRMIVLYIVLPLALLMVGGAVLAFVWSERSGQYDDLETPAVRVLHD
jgi:cbb3-type cytochrome oxidase maturation protein